jgi:predicted DNA-binding transcriptional regulator YafY
VRADRVLSLLMLLQKRGRMTAEALAIDLEVSVRTIYRDIDALSAMGVPVCTERGPGGGCALLEGYRTTLTGLTSNEVRALFMLSIPAPLAQLGVTQELKTALLKLTAALPAARRIDEEYVRQRVHLDSVWWFQAAEPVPYLPILQQAVWEDRRLHLTYRLPLGGQMERLVDPYGLVAKAGVWYLAYACQGQVHAQRVSEVLAARLSDERFVHPAGFDLTAWWQAWCTQRETDRPIYQVKARVSPGLSAELPRYFGERARESQSQSGPPDATGWLTLTLSFETIESARERILGFGGAIEVLEPEALRRSVADFAARILAVYPGSPAESGVNNGGG